MIDLQLLLIVLIRSIALTTDEQQLSIWKTAWNSMMQWLSTPNSWSCTRWKCPSLLFISSKLYTSYSYLYDICFISFLLHVKAQTSNTLFIYTNLYFPTTSSFYSFLHAYALSTSSISISKSTSFFMKILQTSIHLCFWILFKK